MIGYNALSTHPFRSENIMSFGISLNINYSIFNNIFISNIFPIIIFGSLIFFQFWLLTGSVFGLHT